MTFRNHSGFPLLACLTRPILLAILIVLPAAAAAQTGSISGTVTNAAGGAPIASLAVRATTLDQNATVTGVTNASGEFTIPGLTPGSYFLYTSTTAGFVNEAYDNIQCPGFCPSSFITAGAPVVVTPGGTTTGVDFALDAGGSITGHITNASDGSPLQNISVTVYTRIGGTTFTVGSGTTDATGLYTARGLASGTFFVVTTGAGNQGFVNEILGNIPCVGSCSSTTASATGTPVSVAMGAVTPDQDFALDAGGRISGVVTDAATSAGIQNVGVNVYAVVSGSTTFAGSAGTDATGSFTVQGLPTGTYYAYTSNNVGYTNEIFDNLLCPLSCQSGTAVASGASIPVTLGATTSGRNFALQLGGTISGTVTDGTNPVAGRQVIVVTRVGNSTYTASAVTNASGAYTVRGLPTGTYWAYTFGGLGFIDEIFDNVQCFGFCSTTDAFARGTPIPVTIGANTGGRDFALSQGGGLSGTVTDAATGQPIAGRIAVNIYAVVGNQYIYAGNRESTLGGYSFGGLLPGNYIVTASATGYIDELYDDVSCWRGFCDFADATLVPVTAGAIASGRNFALAPGDLVTGTVTEQGTGAPLPNVTVTFYQRVGAGGVSAGSAVTGPAGTYRMRGLPAGTYVAYTSNSPGYFGEIYNDIRCAAACSSTTALASGTAIAVSGTPLTSGIDFALSARDDAPAAPTNLRAVTDGFNVQFTWSAPSVAAGGAATSYILEAGVSPGTTIVTIPVNTTSYLAAAVPPGTFYVRVRGVNAAGTGAPSAEVVLTVTASGSSPLEPPTNVVAFMSGGLLTLTWAAPATGGVPTGYVVEAGSATGLANIATVPVSARSFTFAPVPNGFYFLRVRARNASGLGAPSVEQMLVVGNVPSPPGPPNFSGASVTGSTVTLNWIAPAFGAPTSYIVEAGSAPGLSNLAVANTGTAALTASFGSVPSGTYYVRVRAVNALGASVVSNERTVVVP